MVAGDLSTGHRPEGPCSNGVSDDRRIIVGDLHQCRNLGQLAGFSKDEFQRTMCIIPT